MKLEKPDPILKRADMNQPSQIWVGDNVVFDMEGHDVDGSPNKIVAIALTLIDFRNRWRPRYKKKVS